MRFALAATVALAASADAFPHMARHLQAHHDMVERAHAHADFDDRGLLDPIGDFFGNVENGIAHLVDGVTGHIKGPSLNDLFGKLTQGRIPSLGDFIGSITNNLKGEGHGDNGNPTSIFDALTKSLTPDGQSIDFSKMDQPGYDALKYVVSKLDLGDIGSKINLGNLGGIGDGNIDIGPFRQAVPRLGDGIDLGKLNLVAGLQQLGIRGMDFLTQLAGEFKTFNPVTMAQFALQIKQARDEILRRAESNPEFGGWPSGLLMNEWAKDLTKDKIYDAYKLHRPDNEHGIWGGGEDADHPYQAPGPDDVRGPCPGLNTLANHGYIPRNGVVNAYDLILGVWEGFSMAPETASLLAFGAFTIKGDLWGPKLSIGGKSKYGGGVGLSNHGFFEGDASITRSDAAVGDCFSLNRTRYDIYRSEIAKHGDNGDINEMVCAVSRERAYLDSRSENPSFDFNPLRELVAYAESGFAMEVFRGAGKRCTADTIEWFFDKERFPPNWKRRNVPVSMTELMTWGMLFQQIKPSNPGYNFMGEFVPIPKVPGTWTSFVSGGTVKMNAWGLTSLFMTLLPVGAATFAIGNGILPVAKPGGFNCW